MKATLSFIQPHPFSAIHALVLQIIIHVINYVKMYDTNAHALSSLFVYELSSQSP